MKQLNTEQPLVCPACYMFVGEMDPILCTNKRCPNFVLDKRDSYSFVEHLSVRESAEFRTEEERVRKAHDVVIKKWNKIVSDRLSKPVTEVMLKDTMNNLFGAERLAKISENESYKKHVGKLDVDTMGKINNFLLLLSTI